MYIARACLVTRNVLKQIRCNSRFVRRNLCRVQNANRKCDSFHNSFRLGLQTNYYSTSTVDSEEAIDVNTFERVCEDTLESLSEYFEQIVESSDNLASADVSYSSGVLTINFGAKYGTYVINRQSPNKQIWLSSPTSGPKRYDFIPKTNNWIYKHDGESLHHLLQDEISKIANGSVDFSKCAYSQR